MNKNRFVSTVDDLQDLDKAARLLDYLQARYGLKSDYALGRMLEMQPSQICKLRHGALGISPGVLLRIHDVTGIPVAQIRAIARGVEMQ